MNSKSILTLVFPGNLNLQKSPSHLCKLLSKAQGHLVVHLQAEVLFIAQIWAGISEVLVSSFPPTLHSTNVKEHKDLKCVVVLLLNQQGQNQQ